MNIIQTYWPGNNHETISEVLNLKGKWISAEYHWMSWALSCLQLKRYYGKVNLYTTQIGKEILVDNLKLPYSIIFTEHDNVNVPKNEIWALAKIFTYSLQTTPFIHFDGDVYIWSKLNLDHKAQLIAQNNEIDFPYYYEIVNGVEKHFQYIPECIKLDRAKSRIIYSANTGIIGGNNLDIFKEYNELVQKFVMQNLKYLDRINISLFNIGFEQYLYYCLAKYHKIDITYLFNHSNKNEFDSSYKGLAVFDKVPYETKFIHALADFKSNRVVCEHLARRLRQDYPDTYYRIIDFLGSRKISIDSKFYRTDSYKINFKNIFKKNDLSEMPPKNPQSLRKDMYSFTRTKRILSDFLNIGQRGSMQLGDIKGILKSLTNISEKNLLQDALNYDISLDRYVKSLRNETYLYSRDIEIYKRTEQLFSLNTETILSTELTFDSNCSIIESKWPWNDLNNIKIFIKEPPAYFQSLLTYDMWNMSINEVGLDSLNIVLLDSFMKPKTIRKSITKISIYFNRIEIFKRRIEFEELVLSRIRKLMFFGALSLTCSQFEKRELT